MMRYILPAFAAIGLLIATASAADIHVVPRIDARALVPVIRPLLGEGGYVSAYEGRLVIRADDDVFARIQTVLEQLPADAQTVTVYLRRNHSSADRDAGVTWSENGIAIHAQSRRSNSQSVYSITTLSGHAAYISQGALIAIVGPDSLALARLEQGIRVIPEVTASGRVRLKIRQRFEQLKDNGRIATQGAATTRLLTPGRWQPLGSIRIRADTGRIGTTGLDTGSRSVTLPLQVKVELR